VMFIFITTVLHVIFRDGVQQYQYFTNCASNKAEKTLTRRLRIAGAQSPARDRYFV
jgi:hypothetical protein